MENIPKYCFHCFVCVCVCVCVCVFTQQTGLSSGLTYITFHAVNLYCLAGYERWWCNSGQFAGSLNGTSATASQTASGGTKRKQNGGKKPDGARREYKGGGGGARNRRTGHKPSLPAHYGPLCFTDTRTTSDHRVLTCARDDERSHLSLSTIYDLCRGKTNN